MMATVKATATCIGPVVNSLEVAMGRSWRWNTCTPPSSPCNSENSERD